MTNNKAREINSPLIKQLIDETSPAELDKIDAEMSNDEDEKEIELIKQLAEQATMKASAYADAYADGYTAGYERALKLIKWQIEHLLPSSKESINTQI
jgi:flagellar biosynthesis/type III secretory pathway protein FliH